jgi:hypothetical protein
MFPTYGYLVEQISSYVYQQVTWFHLSDGPARHGWSGWNFPSANATAAATAGDADTAANAAATTPAAATTAARGHHAPTDAPSGSDPCPAGANQRRQHGNALSTGPGDRPRHRLSNTRAF